MELGDALEYVLLREEYSACNALGFWIVNAWKLS